MKIFGFINLFAGDETGDSYKNRLLLSPVEKITSNSFEADSKEFFMVSDFNADYFD